MSKDAKKSSESFRRTEELLEYLEKVKLFTEELMKENARLRIRVLQLEKEKMDLQSRMDPKHLNLILDENRDLRVKLETLTARFDKIETENKDFAQR
jgi:hypothetical protein